MRVKLWIIYMDCPHCKKTVTNNDLNMIMTGDSEPYVEEEQKQDYICPQCGKKFFIYGKFSTSIDTE